jgi:UDP:flavonoid glycosyltransferase YjiC (YdhE family)
LIYLKNFYIIYYKNIFIIQKISVHPNLRAFITHCGQNSLNEAARAGVPVITMPLFGDQIYNSILAKEKGIAFEVSVAELNEAGGETLIIEALENVRFLFHSQ